LYKIKLNNHKIYPWSNLNELAYVRGYFYDSNGKTIHQIFLLKKLIKIKSPDDFADLLKNIDGCFSIILKNKNLLFAATDRIRSFPLFYSYDSGKVILRDKLYRNKSKEKISNLSSYEFTHTGYVTNDNTLLENVFQIQAGEYIFFDSSNLNKSKYYDFLHFLTPIEDYEEMKFSLKTSINNSFSRLINSTQDKRLIIPLSGGLDSRLIVTSLHKYGKKNVVCFTYGLAKSKEVEVSKSIAKDLGYEWHFVNYGNKIWKQCYSSDLMKEYLLFSGNLCSLPHMQDWPAVWQLKSMDVLCNNSIFIPGHAADFVAGSHIPHDINLLTSPDIKTLKNMIIKEHFKLSKKIYSNEYETLNSKLMKNIENPFLNKKIDSIDDVANLFEYWDWQERQAKFIANSCRVYEFWGYEWRLPFWDRGFVDFWRAVPLSQRLNKKLYKEVLIEDDYKNIFSRYNYKNYEKRDLIHYLKKSVFGKYLSMLHKPFYGYHKFQYLDIVGYKDLIFKYRNHNINSILAIKYLKTLEIE